MDRKGIYIETIDANSLLEMFSRLERQIQEIKQHFQPKEPVEWITRYEVAELLRITLPTVHAWANKGVITSYKIGNKTRFKRSEVEAAMTRTGMKENSILKTDEEVTLAEAATMMNVSYNRAHQLAGRFKIFRKTGERGLVFLKKRCGTDCKN